MISRLFSRTNPVAAAASPEYELSRDMTTGISAPPIGITNNNPRIPAEAISMQRKIKLDGLSITRIPKVIVIIINRIMQTNTANMQKKNEKRVKILFCLWRFFVKTLAFWDFQALQ